MTIATYPTEDGLRDRITTHLKLRNSSEIVVLIWQGYLAALLEYSLINVDIYTRMCELLPNLGSPELIEVFEGPIPPEEKAEMQEHFRKLDEE